MKRFCGALLTTVFVCGAANLARADDQDVKATLDKAIKALGGEENLKKADAHTTKAKGKITFGDNDNEFSGESTTQGLDHFRSAFEVEINGNKVNGVTVLNGDKGWRKFGDNLMEMDADAVANEKRTVYLAVIPATILPLKGKDFKVEAAGEEKVADKPATVLKVTPPDGKEFKLFFDKESGLPVRLEARVVGFGGEDFNQETNYRDYKVFSGIKKPTKTESKRDGQKFVESELVDFKILDRVDPDMFSEPK